MVININIYLAWFFFVVVIIIICSFFLMALLDLIHIFLQQKEKTLSPILERVRTRLIKIFFFGE